MTVRFVAKNASFAALFCAAACAPVAAAQAAPVRIRGTIAAVKGDDVTIASRDGSKISLKLEKGYTVGTVRRARLSDIKPNDYIGATTIPRRDGKLVALEVHIFPADKRGTGEGSRPWDLAPNSMMTNADVTGSVASAQGRVLTMTYKGGQKTILVTPKTPIVFNVAGSPTDVRPGVGVVVQASKAADGSYETRRIVVGKDGVNPPD